jgi:hypothetical protein
MIIKNKSFLCQSPLFLEEIFEKANVDLALEESQWF